MPLAWHVVTMTVGQTGTEWSFLARQLPVASFVPMSHQLVLLKIVQLSVDWILESTAFGMGRRELLPQV
jgi:hypothetical protein